MEELPPRPDPRPLAVLACPECDRPLARTGPGAYACPAGHAFSNRQLLTRGLEAVRVGLLASTAEGLERLGLRARGLALVAREAGESDIAAALEEAAGAARSGVARLREAL